MNYQYLEYEKEGPIAVITLNRPQNFNALNLPLMAEIGDVSYSHPDLDLPQLCRE